MTRNLNVGDFKSLCHEVNDFIGETQQSFETLIGLLTEVLMAQGFQDLTGQVIRRIIELVREVEVSLINLLTVFGTPVESSIELQEQQKEESNTKLDESAEGPIIDAASRDDVVSGQDEVDDLLSSLGF
jgi:chemotaxis protein CheZ